MSRPEHIAPPEIFYNEDETTKYTHNTRIQQIQAEMTLRALDLMNLPRGQHILDIGCGSGLSGEILTEEGHVWIGMDISAAMLGTALDRDVTGDLMLSDIGAGIPFRAGSFDAAISISAIQWLCNADTAEANPRKRLLFFFQTLYASLKRGGRAVCQFYPSDEKQTELITHAAKVTGFGGGLIIDHPESKKNKKYYLVLTAGEGESQLNLKNVEVDSMKSRRRSKNQGEDKYSFIKRKKDVQRRRGKAVPADSKFSGRKRHPRF